MWTERAAEWLKTASELLKPKPTSDDPYPNDRLPSEQVIGDFALRGYRGPTVLVAAQRYFAGTLKLSGFVANHAHDMSQRGWPVSHDIVERDITALEELAERCDAVRVRPAR